MSTVNLNIFLRRIFTQWITVRKVTETRESNVYGSITRETRDYSIRGAVYPNTYEETYWATMGGLRIGDARGYFFLQYEKDTGEPAGEVPEPSALIEVKENDLIIVPDPIPTNPPTIYEIINLNIFSEWKYTIKEAYLRKRIAEP